MIRLHWRLGVIDVIKTVEQVAGWQEAAPPDDLGNPEG